MGVTIPPDVGGLWGLDNQVPRGPSVQASTSPSTGSAGPALGGLALSMLCDSAPAPALSVPGALAKGSHLEPSSSAIRPGPLPSCPLPPAPCLASALSPPPRGPAAPQELEEARAGAAKGGRGSPAPRLLLGDSMAEPSWGSSPLRSWGHADLPWDPGAPLQHAACCACQLSSQHPEEVHSHVNKTMHPRA